MWEAFSYLVGLNLSKSKLTGGLMLLKKEGFKYIVSEYGKKEVF